MASKKLNPRKLDDRLKQLGIDYEAKKKLKATILKHQGYKCAICKKDLRNENPVNIHLDHSHKPPFEIRGILCSFCNRYIITSINEARPYLFKNAYTYLTSDKEWLEKLIEMYKK